MFISSDKSVIVRRNPRQTPHKYLLSAEFSLKRKSEVEPWYKLYRLSNEWEILELIVGVYCSNQISLSCLVGTLLVQYQTLKCEAAPL